MAEVEKSRKRKKSRQYNVKHSRRRSRRYTLKKKNTYFKNYDLYSDANPKDTVHVRYDTLPNLQKTIRKLERLYKSGKYPHKRIVQICNVMKQRLRVIHDRYHKSDENLKEITRYFNFLKKRTNHDKKTRKKLTYKFHKKKSFRMVNSDYVDDSDSSDSSGSGSGDSSDSGVGSGRGSDRRRRLIRTDDDYYRLFIQMLMRMYDNSQNNNSK